MKAGSAEKDGSVFAMLPSVDDLLRSETGRALLESVGQKRLTELSRVVIDDLRQDLKDGDKSNGRSKSSLLDEACTLLDKRWSETKTLGLRRVINATGVIVHTNLGRSPLSNEARNALVEAS